MALDTQEFRLWAVTILFQIAKTIINSRTSARVAKCIKYYEYYARFLKSIVVTVYVFVVYV